MKKNTQENKQVRRFLQKWSSSGILNLPIMLNVQKTFPEDADLIFVYRKPPLVIEWAVVSWVIGPSFISFSLILMRRSTCDLKKCYNGRRFYIGSQKHSITITSSPKINCNDSHLKHARSISAISEAIECGLHLVRRNHVDFTIRSILQ